MLCNFVCIWIINSLNESINQSINCDGRNCTMYNVGRRSESELIETLTANILVLDFIFQIHFKQNTLKEINVLHEESV